VVVTSAAAAERRPWPSPRQRTEHESIRLTCFAARFGVRQDGMVRTAVRTLTLNVYSIPDAAVQSFVSSSPASNYFTELAIRIAELCQVCARACPCGGTNEATP
jgi:hypothetical protein